MLHGYKIAAVCLSKLHDDTLLRFVQNLTEALRPHGWRVMVFMTGSDLYQKSAYDKGEAGIFDLLDPAFADAVLLFPNKLLDADCVSRIMERVRRANVPLLFVDGHCADCCCLNFDYTKGFSEVVRHLVEVHDVRDFHFIAGIEGNAFSEERIDVMRSVLAEYDIPFGEDDISYGQFWSEPAKAAVKRLIEEHRVPRAVVCANDTMAIAVSHELRYHGFRIPEDVIVTGFDGIDEIRYSTPKLTSAVSDFGELGERAAELCLMIGRGEPLPERVDILPQLVLQESCGCHQTKSLDALELISMTNNSFNRYQNEAEKLHEISSRIQASDTLEQVAEQLHDRIFYCLQVLLKKECIDFSLDPMVQHSASTYGNEMYVLANTNQPELDGQYLQTKDLVQGLPYILQEGMPLIFLALHSIDLPLGYLCFTFEGFNRQNYQKMYQEAMSLGVAIAGFRSRHYQQHLRGVVEATYKYDTLTGLFSRSVFLRQLAQIPVQSGQVYTVVLVDLDGLKTINDTYGHADGDFAIAAAAHCLHDVCMDGLCTRYGGDEFVSYLMQPVDVGKLYTALQNRLAEFNAISGKPYQISASIGIYQGTNESFEEMFAKADQIMYAEKSRKPHRRKT